MFVGIHCKLYKIILSIFLALYTKDSNNSAWFELIFYKLIELMSECIFYETGYDNLINSLMYLVKRSSECDSLFEAYYLMTILIVESRLIITFFLSKICPVSKTADKFVNDERIN